MHCIRIVLFSFLFSSYTAAVSNTFKVGEGPALFRNVTCDHTHSELSQCVHPLSIGLRVCDSPDKRAGVICQS